MTLKKLKKSIGDDTNNRGGYLIMYFPGVGLITVRAACVVCGKKSTDSGSLLDKEGKPTKEAKYVKPSFEEIREGRIAYRHSVRLYGIYTHGDAGVIQEVFEGLFAFVPFLDLNVEARVLAACEEHVASQKS